MKRILLLVLVFSFIRPCDAQTKLSLRKYPSLFWEITGNGLSRPSYLFGTMHVSSKMVFHLPDSFYLGIKNVDVVALETNPESWQEDLVKYDIEGNSYGRTRYPWTNFRQVPDDYLNIRTLQFKKYEKQIEAALYSRPSTINNLLYRNYSDYASDFEENTYLDMYIYQVGKKMGKRVAGVERYDESMKLMMEAYRDAAKDKNYKERSYDREDNYSADKLQEAYRAGNLDLLDSINKLNSFSNAFDEKFLYSRNYLQANSIDSILKTRSSLFVGVGAAHLPGKRGVIEILRKLGYIVRPITMGERDSEQKDLVEKLRVPVSFSSQTSEDGFFEVDIPGKFYRFNEDGVLDQLQYADMANGSYYMVTRIKTNSRFWGHTADLVTKKIDSLLYENIPGKILSKQQISRNGYKGLDITNLTRRGDLQRYNIFITPYEVIIFKMSGNGDYIREGDESKRFFNSIQLKEYKTDVAVQWKKYQPSFGGFWIELPHEPFVSKNRSWQFEAEDKTTGTDYTILRTDIHNYAFAEEDSFDLNLLQESFSSSEFISKLVSRKFVRWKGYPALDCKWLHRNGSSFWTRFIIQGPHYYTLIAHGARENGGIQSFFDSFEIRPFSYKNDMVEKKDTTLYYAVKTTYYPEEKKIKLSIPGENGAGYTDDDDDDDIDLSNRGTFKNNVIENDSTGEKIYLSFYKTGRYYYNEDSATANESRLVKNRSWIIRHKSKYDLRGQWKVTEFQLSDTNSSRLVWTKSFYKNGIGFFLATEGDTLSAPSSFVKSFFESFNPVDTLTGFNPFVKKSAVFFKDFFSADTATRRRAVAAIPQVKLDSSDFIQLKKAIESVNWSDKKYLDTKKLLLNKLGEITTRQASDYLKQLYYAAGDTIEIQYAALESLLQQQTQYAFTVFKDIVSVEPPVLEVSSTASSNDFSLNRVRFSMNSRNWNGTYDNGEFWDELYDSLKLTRTILPDVLPLLNLDDYKWRTMRLLARMVDSGLVKGDDYESYFNKFFIEAKQELKKQAISEKKRLIEKASTKNSKIESDGDIDYGNEKLNLYAKLLLPFWKKNASIPTFFQQLLQSNDNKLKYNAMLLMIQHGKAVPDSLRNHFAAKDEYRYLFYNDLDEIGQLKYFPTKYNNHVDLAKSKLLDSKAYSKPDSVVYLNKLAAEFLHMKGYIYFFKFKDKKDDLSWKLATVGLISTDPNEFEIKDTTLSQNETTLAVNWNYRDRYDFTAFTNTKLKPNEEIASQLEKQLKKMLYSRRKSAKEFYNDSNTDFEDTSMRMRD